MRSRLERIGDVHVLTLCNPDKRNAIGHELAAEIVGHTDQLAGDPSARTLVVTGEGQAFSAGADLPDVFGRERSTSQMQAELHAYYGCFLRIRALPFPTFAAVEGAAIGAGLNLALSCDIRIASPRARFGATFTRIGLHPGGGCAYFLTTAIGRERTLRVLLEGATLDADEALGMGLVSEVAEDAYVRALELAANAAAIEPWLAQSIKRSVDLSTAAETVLMESWAQAESTHNPRFREWIDRFSV